MQGTNTGEPGIWRVGVLLEASSLEQLKDNPMKLIKSVADTADNKCHTIALCKQNLLSTYEFITDYTAPASQAGCLLQASDQSKCKYPSVVISPVSHEKIDFQDLYTDIQITPKQLEISIGLPHPTVPNLLFASQHFMQTYGFFTREQVWYRYLTPVPLERVTLTPCESSELMVLSFPEEVIGQLYEQCRREPVTMQQDFDFIFRAKLPSVSTSMKATTQEKPTSEEKVDYVLTFRVLEATPTLQGVVTEDTTIVLLPSDTQDLGSDWLNRSSGSRSSRRRSTRDDSIGMRRESVTSASDILEDEAEEQSGRGYEDYIIDVVAAEDFKLQTHCIVLPKLSSSAHGIFHCQTIWACAVNNRSASMVTNFDDLTLTLANGQYTDNPRMHSALVFVYDDEFELEQYVPQKRLGVEYECGELTRAYIHPELLFYLFPETLAYSRTFQLHIKVS